MARSHRWKLWGKYFRDVGKRTPPHDALMILLPSDVVKSRPVGDVLFIVTRMTMAEHESFTQNKDQPSYLILYY